MSIQPPRERPLRLGVRDVRLVLAGLKTQIRFPLKPQPACVMEMLNADFTPRGDFYISSRRDANRGSSGRFCPLGRPGDRLWIRETYSIDEPGVDPIGIQYRADAPQRVTPWVPAAKMPKKYSRITLEITAVIAQRLNEISETEAIAEGNPLDEPPWDYPISRFAAKWDLFLKNNHAWIANPWVWAVSFRRLEKISLP